MNSKETQINIILARDREPRGAGIVDIRFMMEEGHAYHCSALWGVSMAKVEQ